MGPSITPDKAMGMTAYQKAVQRRIAEMYASGSQKAGLVNDIYSTMLESEDKKALGDMLTSAKNQYRKSQLDLRQGELDLDRSALARSKKDATLANWVSGAGALAQGYSGYKEGQADKRQAEILRGLARRYEV